MGDRQGHLHQAGALILARLAWVCLAGGIVSGSFLLEERARWPRPQWRYVPPVAALRLISGSFQSVCADVFYLRGVQAVTDVSGDRLRQVEWVQKLFETATELDPGLTQAYFFAGVVIGRDEPSIRKGIEFLARARRRAPAVWQLPYWIGLNEYQLGDYLEAVEWYERAASLPGAPAFLRSMQPMLYYRAGRPELGMRYLEGLRLAVRDPAQLRWIDTKLAWLRAIVQLEEQVGRFRARVGRWPQRLDELVTAGLLAEIPADPFGRGFYFDADSARVRSAFDQPGPSR